MRKISMFRKVSLAISIISFFLAGMLLAFMITGYMPMPQSVNYCPNLIPHTIDTPYWSE